MILGCMGHRIPTSPDVMTVRPTMNGTTMRHVGLIGDPVGHSISPRFQQAAFDALGIAARYEAWQTPLEDLSARVQWLREVNALGANVTVPHKESVLPLLDGLDPPAARAGAVNTIVQRDGVLTGYNTDIAGFLDALRNEGNFDPKDRSALVLGAGGAARAVAIGLLDAGVARLAIHNRTAERAERLCRELADDRMRLHPRAADGRPARFAGDLVVNTTTLGMRRSEETTEPLPLDPEHIPATAFVYDIIANPLVTPLMAVAAARGCPTLGGLPMLVHQGAHAFSLWTGRDAPLGVMMEAARRAMSG